MQGSGGTMKVNKPTMSVQRDSIQGNIRPRGAWLIAYNRPSKRSDQTGSVPNTSEMKHQAWRQNDSIGPPAQASHTNVEKKAQRMPRVHSPQPVARKTPEIIWKSHLIICHETNFLRVFGEDMIVSNILILHEEGIKEGVDKFGLEVVLNTRLVWHAFSYLQFALALVGIP